MGGTEGIVVTDRGSRLSVAFNRQNETQQNVKTIAEVLDSPIHNVLYLEHNDLNTFGSKRPHRDFENDSVSYCNNYLTVYRKLSLYQVLVFCCLEKSPVKLS